LAEINSQTALEIIGTRLDSYKYLPAEGTRGGILFGWQSDFIEANNLVLKDFSLTMDIKLKWFDASFKVTTVYGPTDDDGKIRFLEELASLRPSSSISWLLLGDFNLIYEARDKNNQNLDRRLMGRFRCTLDRCELLELALQNWKYTWSNERQDPTLVRLDRAFCNKEWDLIYPGFSLHALSSSVSDHCPLLLCQQDKPRRREVFRFENLWVKILGFTEVVKESWQQEVPGSSPLNILSYKLQNTARALRGWSKKLFGNARMELSMANEIIQRLDVAQDTRQLSDEEFQLQKELKIRVLGLAAIERSCSRLIWLKEGDACTRFFHLRANGRSRKNFIHCLKDESGVMAWSHEEKEKILHCHFQNILGKAERRHVTLDWAGLDLPRLSDQHLDDAFTEAEIKQAISDLPAEKAPGPDGFTGVFYRACWDIIKSDIVAAFQCIYNLHTGPLPKLNGALLTLLPKKEVAESPGDFRPISLIHSFAKLISKVLAMRLSTQINSLVSQAQSAFIKRRCI
jgi:hypothetical protein